jgi:hypothetical protein
MNHFFFQLAMLTAPRPVATITESIASLRAAGFDERLHVFSDDCSNVVMDGNVTTSYRARMHELPNWYSALKSITALDADMYLMLEDDTTWQPGARSTLERWMANLRWCRADFGALSLHCMRHVSRSLERQASNVSEGQLPAGTYRAELGADVWGSQALLFTRASAQALLDLPAFMQASCMRERVDAAVGRGLQLLQLDLLYLLPCLVRHDLGRRNSALYGTAGRVIDSPGRECCY